MSTIDVSHLKLLAIFVAVVEQKSFASAARVLGSSRSRISEQVANIESVLGVRLLQRSTRQLLLTEEGEKVYAEAQKLTEIMRNVEASVTPAKPSGRVRITMNHDIAHQFFLPILPKFKAFYPDIELDLILDDGPRDLIAEQIDVAIRIGFPKDSSLIARPLFEDQFCLFASPSFVKDFGEPKSLDCLKPLPWIALSQVFSDGVIRLRNNGELFELRPERMSRCNSPYMVQKMVMAGLGIAALLPRTVAKQVKAKQLIPVMPAIESDTLVFSLLYPSRKHMPMRTRVLVDFIVQHNPFTHDTEAS